MPICSIPLAETLAALRSGELDLQQHIHQVCDRIDEIEDQVQALVAESKRRERLLREAAELQVRYPDPDRRPSLYGALAGIKDIFRVDGFPIRAGSQLPPELFGGPEAVCIRALRQAGASILGKTITTEFAYFEPGPTRNPHNPAHTPGGSSSGSAAAVAAGFSPLTLGTQTVGSVIRPAAFCGIVGFKPSFGRIATEGLIYFSESVDHVGLFTQDVAGMRQAGSVLCRDWQSATSTDKPVLGVPEGPYLGQAMPEGLEAFEAQIERLQEGGYVVRRVSVLKDIEAINQRHRQLSSAEMAQVHASWFAAHGSLYRPRTAAIIREGQQVGREEVERGRAGRLELRIELEDARREEGIDAWVCPSATGPAPEGLSSTGDPLMNLPWTHAGLPALSLPAGRAANGLPLGLQCVAGFGRDEELLKWGEEAAEIVKPEGAA